MEGKTITDFVYDDDIDDILDVIDGHLYQINEWVRKCCIRGKKQDAEALDKAIIAEKKFRKRKSVLSYLISAKYHILIKIELNAIANLKEEDYR